MSENGILFRCAERFDADAPKRKGGYICTLIEPDEGGVPGLHIYGFYDRADGLAAKRALDRRRGVRAELIFEWDQWRARAWGFASESAAWRAGDAAMAAADANQCDYDCLTGNGSCEI